MQIKFENILVLAPHTDDGEFGCGGTIAKMIEGGTKISYIAFSTCEDSVPSEFPKNILEKEVKEATAILGIKKENLHILNYRVRHFPTFRQNILEDLIRYKLKIKPDLVLIPSPKDVHQDHSTVASEAIRAFKFSSIFCYELLWNNIEFTNTCFISLDESHVKKKCQAISKYDSQKHRGFSSTDFVVGQCKLRGIQSKNIFAEVFEIIRLMI